MRLPLLIFLFVWAASLKAQVNLVPNPSFENHTGCPNNISQITLATPWANPNTGSPDYFNECCIPYIILNDTFYPVGVPENGWGYQEANTGVAYAGFYTYQSSPHREYIEVRLNAQLVKDKKYLFSAYISLADKTGLGTKLGAYFSTTEINSDSINLWQYSPQIVTPYSDIDKDNWVLWKDTITSENGNEEYLIIGNFLNIINSDTIYSGTDSGGYRWNSYYYIDDVSVISLDTTTAIPETEKPKLKIFPNPAGNQITIEQLSVSGNQLSVEVYDALGRLVTLSIVQGQQTTIPLNLSKGVYLLRVKEKEEVVFWEKLIIE